LSASYDGDIKKDSGVLKRLSLTPEKEKLLTTNITKTIFLFLLQSYDFYLKDA